MTGAFSARLAVALESSGTSHLRRRRFEAYDDRPLEEMRAIAVAADRLGYELLLMPEASGRDAFVTLADLAVRTSRIQLGTGVVNIYSRTPASIAMAVASLDELSGKRAVLGLGTSGSALIEGWHAMPARHALRRLREATELIRVLLARTRAGFAGSTFRLASGLALRFEPSRAAIPIFHGSLSPASVRQCVEIADGWLPSFISAASIRKTLDELEALIAPRRAQGGFTVAAYFPTLVTEDEDWARAVMQHHVAYYVGRLGRFYREALERQGHGDVVAAVLAALASIRPQQAALAVPDDLLNAVCIWGSPQRCRDHLVHIRAAGVDLPVLVLPTSATLEDCLRTLEVLAPSPSEPMTEGFETSGTASARSD